MKREKGKGKNIRKTTGNGAQTNYPRIDAKLLVYSLRFTSVSFAFY